MPQYTKAQLEALRHVAEKAYSRISAAISHDPDLRKADLDGFSTSISHIQGGLLDLEVEINSLLKGV